MREEHALHDQQRQLARVPRGDDPGHVTDGAVRAGVENVKGFDASLLDRLAKGGHVRGAVRI